MGKTDKIGWIEIVQGWAILCVIVGHAPLLSMAQGNVPPAYVQALFDFVYSFHMPLFVFLSGYLFQMTRIERPMPYKKMFAEKLVRLAVPAVTFIFLAMVLKVLFPGEMVRPVTLSPTALLEAIVYPGNSALHEIWFIPAILWCFALQPLWKATEKQGVAVAVGIISVATFYLYPMEEPVLADDNLFCYKEALHHLLFFMLGVVVKRYGILERPVWQYTAAGVTVSAVISSGEYLAIGESILGFAILGITLSIAGAMIADRYIPNLFSSFRRYYFQIYLMGLFAQVAVKIAYRHGYIPSYALGYALCIICGIYLPVVAGKIVEKIDNRYLKTVVGLK